MKLFFVILSFFAFATSFAQQTQPSFRIAEIEKKGNITAESGNGVFSTLASGDFITDYARFHWNINPAYYYISGSVLYYITLTKQAGKIVFDLDNSLVVDSVTMHGEMVGFNQDSNKTLTIFFTQTLAAGQKDSLAIYYHGAPANNGSGSFTQSTHNNNVPVIWTLSEPYGARGWWPCRNGLDDKIDSMDIYITHPSEFAASANGVLADTIVSENYVTSHFRHRYPIATYLVGIAVTNYVSFTKQIPLQHGMLPVVTTVYPEFIDYFQTYTPDVYNALTLYDRYFGDYPFLKERYGQTQFDWSGGIEHQSNSFIKNADEYLMAHELAHQWFGDKITLASWQDIWLNEGFATYLADIFYTEHLHPENLAAIVSQSMNYATAEPDGSVWVDDTTDVNRIFNFNLSYKKGAMLLRMLRWTLGDPVFFSGINQYLQDSALQYGFARTKDLQSHLETVYGNPLNDFFTQWFYGKGYPSFFVKWNRKNNNMQLQITETTSHASVKCFAMPLQLKFKNGSEEKDVVIHIGQNITNLSVPISFEPDTILIDPSQYVISKNNISQNDSNLLVIDDSQGSNTLVVYPNPANDILYIRFPADDPADYKIISISDVSGKIVYKRTNFRNGDNPMKVPVSHLSKGVYFVFLQSENGNIIKRKFIKQ